MCRMVCLTCNSKGTTCLLCQLMLSKISLNMGFHCLVMFLTECLRAYITITEYVNDILLAVLACVLETVLPLQQYACQKVYYR